MLPAEVRDVLENGLPAMLGTCATDGTPNVSIVSDVYWVDEGHVAVSFQFFSKTIRNVRENPRATILLNDPAGARHWVLDVNYERSEDSGAVFEAMEMRIEAIASATGMSGIFKLRSADVYRVVGVRTVPVA